MAWGQQRGVGDLVSRLAANSEPAGASLLILSTRSFGDADCPALCEALAANDRVEELLASGHKLSAEGARCFGAALQTNATLKRLALGDEALGNAAVEALVDGWRNETLLELDLELKGLGAAGVRALDGVLAGKAHALVELKLGRNLFGDQGVRALCRGLGASASLSSLGLQNNEISAEGCAALGAVLASADGPRKSLKLSLDGNAFGSAGLVALTGQQVGQQDVGASASVSVSDSSSNSSSSSIQVVWLSVEECEVGVEGARALGRAMSLLAGPFASLECLRAGSNAISDGAWLGRAAAREGSRLGKAYIGRNPLGVNGVLPLASALAECAPSNPLRLLDLSGAMRDADSAADVSAVLHSLARAAPLEQLDLLGNALGDGGALLLAQELVAAGSGLKVLGLACVGLSGSGLRPLLDALLPHESLATLELGGNELGDEGTNVVEAFRAEKPSLDIAVDMKEAPMSTIKPGDDPTIKPTIKPAD